MITYFESMTVAEFQCRHQDPDGAASGLVQVSMDVELTDINGIPLPLDAGIRVKYLADESVGNCDFHSQCGHRPLEYCVADEEWITENKFVRNEGAYRPL